MKLQPLNDRVIIKRDKAEEVSPGGIVIPSNAQEKTQTGTVLAVGTSCTEVKVHDRVLFGKYAGTDYAESVILREEDIIAVVFG